MAKNVEWTTPTDEQRIARMELVDEMPERLKRIEEKLDILACELLPVEALATWKLK